MVYNTKKEINKFQEEINNLHRQLVPLVLGWNILNEIESRQNRDWKAYDRLDEIAKLLHRINEAKKYNSMRSLDTISTTGSEEGNRNE